MTDNQETTGAFEARQRRSISHWVEENVGGRVTNVQRLRRWRPVWRVDYDRQGVSRSVLVKSLRPWEAIPYSLDHEMRLMQILERNGIPVPHVYGMMDFPEAFVMDWAEGGRDPGLVQQAIETKSGMSKERWAASLRYMEALARMHKIPLSEFEGIESGQPNGPEEIALASYERNYRLLEKRGAVDALIAFFTLWLRRNVPRHRLRATFVTGDCGQFLSKGEDITAILDVEIGHLGDPLHDLACFRGRHPVENMGDVPALYRHYAEVSGEPLDLPVIAYHTVVFLALATIGPMLGMIEKHPGGDWVEGIMQLAFIGRRTVEAMAELADVTLNDELSLPPAHPTPYEDLAFDKLISEIDRLPISETFESWQRDVLALVPRYLRNQAHYSRWAEEEELADIAAAIGRRPADLVEADRLLKAFVQKADASQDAALLKLFHRKMLRLCLVLAGPDAPKDHLLFMKVEPILAMRTS